MSTHRLPRFPNETPWLSQFDRNDLSIAEALLDSILFVPESEFVRWIGTALTNLHDHIASPLAAFAVREPNSDGSYFPGHRGHRPTPIIQKSVGSEAIVAQRIERLAKQRKGIYSHPCLATIKQNKIHDIALVDDTVGSGNTILKFLAAMNKHPTFKSWASRHYLRFWVISYVATMQGRDAILSELKPGRLGRRTPIQVPGKNPEKKRKVQRFAPRIYPARTIEFSSHSCDPTYDPRIVNLAKRYGRRAGLWWPLGYKKSFTLLAFDHGCPNNAPGILWETRNNWIPLFENRMVSIPSGSSVPEPPHHHSNSSELSIDARRVLTSMARGIRQPSRIARSTGIPRSIVIRSMDELRQSSLVSSSNRLIVRQAHLSKLILKETPAQDVSGAGSTYIPSQLRGVSDAF